MAKINPLGFTLLALAPALGTLQAADLAPETLSAWERYVQTADLRMTERVEPPAPFLWLDESADRSRRARDGEILVSGIGGDSPKAVPHGLIHDWIGGIFVPNATMDEVLAVVQDYGRHKDFYKPGVIDAKLLGRTGDQRRFSMIWLQKVLLITATLDGDYTSSFVRVNAKQWYSVAVSTRLQEVREYGQSGERRLPPNKGSGYVWRLHSIARFEERDGGVYVELEAIALSRNIPVSLRWLVAPVVARLSRDSVAASLRQTRDATNSAGKVASRTLDLLTVSMP